MPSRLIAPSLVLQPTVAIFIAACGAIATPSPTPTAPPTRTPIPPPEPEVLRFWCDAMDFFKAEGALIDAYNSFVQEQEESPAFSYDDRQKARDLAAQAGSLWELAQLLPRPAPARDAADKILEYATTIMNQMDAFADYAATRDAESFDRYRSALQDAVRLRDDVTDALEDLDDMYHNVLWAVRCQ